MPNMKNAKKRVLVNIKKEKANNEFAASMKTAIKNVERAIVSKDKEKANDKLKVAIKTIDKAAGKEIIFELKKAIVIAVIAFEDCIMIVKKMPIINDTIIEELFS